MALPSIPLTWMAQTALVNRIKPPARFLTNLLGIPDETLPVETVVIATVTGERDTAPFVRVGGEAVMVGGLGGAEYVVQAPNIRLKRPFTPSQLLFGRQPGTVVFPTGDQVVSAVEAHIARDLKYMNNMIDNTEEWMVSQALRGVISYSVTDQEVFTVTFARAAGNTIDPTIHWDETNNDPIADIRAIQALIAEAGYGITDAIMGSEAAAQFRKNANILAAINLQANRNAGLQDLAAQFRKDGALLAGNFMGINFWEYPRKVRIAGTATDLIRAKYIEFVTAGPEGDWVRYYGAIPDMDALEGGLLQSKRFSKSWKQPDPSALMALVHSRPLPMTRQPDSTVSFKAVSG